MKLWLDDIREPWKHGAIGYMWAKTYDEAVEMLTLYPECEYASLDHDLSELATTGMAPKDEKTGYSLVCWMEENNRWPSDGCDVHSLNPSGKARMIQVLEKYGKYNPKPRS